MLVRASGANIGGVSDDVDPEVQLARYAADLGAGIREALGPWTVRCVVDRVEAWTGQPARDEVVAAARAAGDRARDEVGEVVIQVLAMDIDDQRTPPLALLRGAVRYPTEVLRDAGVPPVVRDEFAERSFPEDDYDLTPANFADLDQSLHDPGLMWGAAKAHVHLRRRRAEGRR